MRLIDANDNDMLLSGAPQPWRILLDSAADLGDQLQQAMPDITTRENTTNSVAVDYETFAQLVCAYVLVRANDDYFFQFWPALPPRFRRGGSATT